MLLSLRPTLFSNFKCNLSYILQDINDNLQRSMLNIIAITNKDILAFTTEILSYYNEIYVMAKYLFRILKK